MSERINLDDPSFEPTDEQLAGLTARAFALRVNRRWRSFAQRKLRTEIGVARDEALKQLEKRTSKPDET